MKKIIFLFLLIIFGLPALAADSSIVVLNKNSKIYHNVNCRLVTKCTKNCIKIAKQQAIDHGARPCKICGG